MNYQEDDREQAIKDVAIAVRNPLVMLSVPDRECAFALADFHEITARDLLHAVCRAARSR